MAFGLSAQSRLTPGVQPFLSLNDPLIALLHVRVIDGTGSPARPDQVLILNHGIISSVGSAASQHVPPNARTLDLTGYTVYPGLIGMHEHLFYPTGGGIPIYGEQALSAPRLYLAAGITTMRTGGSLEPYTDLTEQ